MSWAGLLYMIAEKLVNSYRKELASNYPKWKITSTRDLLEDVPEDQVLQAAKKVGLISNQKLNIYRGWLATRTQCAHPTLFQPSRNVALGFVDAVVAEISAFI